MTSESTRSSNEQASPRRRSTATSPQRTILSLNSLRRRASLAGPAWIEREVRVRGTTPEEQLLAIFDVYDEWFHQWDYEGCPFIRVMLEMGTTHPLARRAQLTRTTYKRWPSNSPRTRAIRSGGHRLVVAPPHERCVCRRPAVDLGELSEASENARETLIDEDRRHDPRARSTSRAGASANQKGHQTRLSAPIAAVQAGGARYTVGVHGAPTPATGGGATVACGRA